MKNFDYIFKAFSFLQWSITLVNFDLYSASTVANMKVDNTMPYVRLYSA